MSEIDNLQGKVWRRAMEQALDRAHAVRGLPTKPKRLSNLERPMPKFFPDEIIGSKNEDEDEDAPYLRVVSI